MSGHGKPAILFEFGSEFFLESSLCNLSQRDTEESLVDAFYALAGYIRACRLGTSFHVRNRSFVKFVTDLLITFSRLPNCPMQRFVWLIEAVHEHLQLSHSSLQSVCDSVINEFASRPDDIRPLVRIQQIMVLSTSPSLCELPNFRPSAETAVANAVQSLRIFAHRYIFGCYGAEFWRDGQEEGLSDTLCGWRLYFSNTLRRMREMELPESLVVAFVDMNLSFMHSYYGDVQPSRMRSGDLRREIFVVVALVVGAAKGKMPAEMLERIWFLLAIAAVSGASEAELEYVLPVEAPDPDAPYLGLEHNEKDWMDYGLALSRLMKKFETQMETFPKMVIWIRANYAQRPAAPNELMMLEMERATGNANGDG
jgi:hypothetical protein